MPKIPKIESFEFERGERLGWKYEVLEWLGAGWEGEVYLVKERGTGIEHAAKFFFPHRNIQNRAFKFYAKKLHKLRNCPVLIRYYTQDTIYREGYPVTFLLSEYVDGEILEDFLEWQPGHRLSVFQGLHLLYALAKGLVPIHQKREYHGDLHKGNIMVTHFGLNFNLKVLDLFQHGSPTPEHLLDDVCDMIRVFYEVIGGEKHYSKFPKEVKDICCGLKRSLISKKYKNATQLKAYLENMSWIRPKYRVKR